MDTNMVEPEKEDRKHGVKVILEFPQQSDEQAEAEFIGRLKEIYLRKMEIGGMRGEEKDG